MATVRELNTKLSVVGNAADKLGKFGFAVQGIKEALGLLTGAFNLAKKVLFDFTNELAKQGDEIAKTAKNVGVSAEELQSLSFAAEIAGADMSVLGKSIQTMNKNLNTAIVNGTGPFVDSLAAVGVTIEDLDGLRPDEKFTVLAESLNKLADESQKSALAQEFFGRGGKRLLPLINEGAEGINKLRAEFKELGGGFTEDGAAAAEEFVDAQTRLRTVIDSVKIAVGTELFPVIQDVVDSIRGWIQANREMLKQRIKEFVQSAINKFRELVPKVKAAFEAFVEFLPTLEKWILTLAELIETMGGLEGALKIAAAAWVGFKVASLAALGPIGLIAGALIALIPIAVEVGEALGDIIFELSELSAEQARLERQQGGRALRRGTKGLLLKAKGPAGLEPSLAQLRSADEATFRDFEKAAQKRGTTTAKSIAKAERARRNEIKNREQVQAAEDKRRRADERKVEARRKREETQKKVQDARKRAKGGKKGKKKEKEEAISDKELLTIIQKAAREQIPLEDLIGQRDIAAGPPPVITVTVTNFNIDQDVNAPVTVSGVSSEIAKDVAELVEENQREILESEFRKAIEDFLPAEAR